MPVLVISYFPFNASGQLIDPSADPHVAVGWPLSRSRQSVKDQVQAMLLALERASTYLGYKDPNAKPALRYHLVKEWEYLKPVPYGRELMTEG